MTKILVVEDEINIQDDIRLFLELEGYVTRGASNGVEGLRVIQEEPPDLICCDVLMPEMDGFELLRTLRDNPATAQVPFIFLSARTAPEDVRKGLDFGATAYLTKPFTSDDLLAAVAQALAS